VAYKYYTFLEQDSSEIRGSNQKESF